MDINDVKNMVDLQTVLNVKYSGDDWRSIIKGGHLNIAFLTEVNEFFEEIREQWHWYSYSKPPLNVNKALFELVDIAHFGLCIMLHRHSECAVKDIFDVVCKPKRHQFTGNEFTDKHLMFVTSVNRFMTGYRQDSLPMMASEFLNITYGGLELIGFTTDKFVEAYKLKNRRNHERVDGGVLTGQYDKKNEGDLTV